MPQDMQQTELLRYKAFRFFQLFPCMVDCLNPENALELEATFLIDLAYSRPLGPR